MSGRFTFDFGGLNRSLGALIAQARKSSGTTQQDLADRVGMPLHTLRRLERGGANIAVGHLQLIATGLGLRVGDLLPAEMHPTATQAPATAATPAAEAPTKVDGDSLTKLVELARAQLGVLERMESKNE